MQRSIQSQNVLISRNACAPYFKGVDKRKKECPRVASAPGLNVFTSYAIIQIAYYSKFMLVHGNILQWLHWKAFYFHGRRRLV